MTATPSPFDHREPLLRRDHEESVARLLIGDSYAIRRLRENILQVATADIPILILGPTGAGKELVARAVHIASKRAGDLVAFNVCAVSESMFEATLFGHTKGAFTGAMADAAGYLAEANDGTLFLDEISGLPLGSQAKLLRAIETGVYRPVGAARDRLSRFRVVAASNEELSARVVKGAFREDLYHRLGGFVLRVPPLHQRVADIRMLVRHFVAAQSGLPLCISDAAMTLLEQYQWPGNVRELKHAVDRMVLLVGEGRTISQSVARAAIETGYELGRLKEDQWTREASRNSLLRVLEDAAWSAERAADFLGVYRATIYRRMRREGITPVLDGRPSQISNRRSEPPVLD